MKVEEILDYKLKKLFPTDKYEKITKEDKEFILAQAKVKIQEYCHRRDMPKAIYYLWADIAIEILKAVDSSLFKKDITTDEELSKRVTSIKAGDSSISIEAAGESDIIDTGYNTNGDDAMILTSFAKQLQAFRKVAAGCGDGTHGV